MTFPRLCEKGEPPPGPAFMPGGDGGWIGCTRAGLGPQSEGSQFREKEEMGTGQG